MQLRHGPLAGEPVERLSSKAASTHASGSGIASGRASIASASVTAGTELRPHRVPRLDRQGREAERDEPG